MELQTYTSETKTDWVAIGIDKLVFMIVGYVVLDLNIFYPRDFNENDLVRFQSFSVLSLVERFR